MAFSTAIAVVVVTAIIFHLEALMIDGYTDPAFISLRDVFRSNFDDGLEKGASFAVFYKGRLVVDLYGGIANEQIGQKWTKHSLSVLFSTTKSISAIVSASIMAKKGLSYQMKVVEIWPEFGQYGKENTTIAHIVQHQAGLPYGDWPVTPDDVIDWKRMSQYFEDCRPIWTPGTSTGYHALTFGFLIDQLVRRIDDSNRGVVDIFREDFIARYGIDDLYIGLPSNCTNNRVAHIEQPSAEDIEREKVKNPKAYEHYMSGDNEHHRKLYETWPWITTEDYNRFENRLLPMPSNMGLGGARGLAHFHSLIAERKVLPLSFMERNLSHPILTNEMDIINGYPESKGYGFQFTKNPKGEWIFGHSGFGGQNVRVDYHNHLAYAYVTNHLKVADADLVRPWKKLIDQLYRILHDN